jgi:predicted CxxxxCH...CXXCH cytochrome family protein
VQGVASPGYTRATGTCAVACHGSTAALGNNTSPPWTSGAIACGDCHAVAAPAPTSGAHTLHIAGAGVQCVSCHPGYSETTINPATHVNGSFEAVITANPAVSPQTKDATHSSWPVTGTGQVDCGGCHL